MADYRSAWMNGDEEKVLSNLSDDIQLFVLGNGTEKLEGKQNVKEFWFPQSDVSYPIRSYEISDQNIIGSGELAIATGKSALVWETVENDIVIDSKTSRSDFMTVLRNEKGQWRIYRQMYQMREAP